MPRVPYVPLDLAEPREIVDAVRARRGGTLKSLDRLLLHSPELARGWNTYLGTVRTRLALSPKLRELAILAVAVLNGAEYEFFHHAPHFIEGGGTRAQLDALRDIEGSLANAELFTSTERAVLAFSVEMTRAVKVSDETFRRAADALGDDQRVIELVATVATYNMVSRFIVALDVAP